MKRLLFAVATAAALWSTACSSGSGTQTPPPPQGMYTLASLNGTYAFVTNGTVATTTTEASFARTGSFVANGQGGITGGVYDTNTQGVVPAQPNVITGGSYTVNADGRGTLTLNINANGAASTINFAIVLSSTSDGLMMDETGALSGQNSSQVSTGSGNFVKQTTADFSVATISGPYVFDFSGLDGTTAPESIIGEFTGSGGVLTTGFEDVNDNFGLSNGAITTGSFTADATYMSTNGRGLVTIAGETYAFYIVDATRVRFISNSNSGNMLTGDATNQTTVPTSVSNINGGFAFLVAGSVGSGGITRVGRFTSTGGALSQLHVDSNTAGQPNLTDVTASAGTITLDPANPGRGTITFTQGGNTGFTAVFYLSSATSGVLQETDQLTSGGVQSAVAVADGTIMAQTGSPSSSTVTGPYAYNWSGQTLQNGNVFDEEDCLGQAKISSLNLAGAADLFEFQVALATDQNAQGPINFNGGDGTTDDGKRPTLQLTIGGNPAISFVLYFVNPQLAFFSNNTAQAKRISAGLIKVQQ
jgi:hypothetical protein